MVNLFTHAICIDVPHITETKYFFQCIFLATAINDSNSGFSQNSKESIRPN